MYMYMYMYMYIYVWMHTQQQQQQLQQQQHIHIYIYIYIYIYKLLENITTEPHAQDISADILRVWLSGYILQHTHTHTYMHMYTHTHTHNDNKHNKPMIINNNQQPRRPEAVTSTLDSVLPLLSAGLEDEDDDVRAVSAEAILPLVPTIIKDTQRHARLILTRLWDTLLQLDDLTASTPSVMNLIAEFFAFMPSFEALNTGTGFENYIRRLWPFFRHNSHSVRRAVLRIFSSALRACQPAGGCSWLPAILSDALHLVFVNIILEQRDDVVTASKALWEDLLEQSKEKDIKVAVEKHLAKWFAAMGTPPGVTLDPACLAGVQNAVRAAAVSVRVCMCIHVGFFWRHTRYDAGFWFLCTCARAWMGVRLFGLGLRMRDMAHVLPLLYVHTSAGST
jgi:hypothetical protein